MQRILILICLSALTPFSSMADEPLQLVEIAPGNFVHQGIHALTDTVNHGDIANIGFIIGDTCVAVVDSGGSPRQGEALRREIAARTSLPVCYVINTHVHPDHILGNLAFRQPGTHFVGHRKLESAMASRAPYYTETARREAGIELHPEHFVVPDLPVSQVTELDLGGRRLQLTAHRTAHTDNDLSILDLKTGTLWLGDLLFMGHLPVVDGSLLGWLREIDALKTVSAARVVPGHGPVQAAWPLALAAEERYLQNLADAVRHAIQSNWTLERAVAEIAAIDRPDWQLYEPFHKRNVSGAFAEMEWEGE